MLRTADLDYELPEELIATRPAEPRDSARLLVVSRTDPSRLEDRSVRDLPGLLRPNDLLVFNTTQVLPARLEGMRSGTGGRVEGLFLREAARGPVTSPRPEPPSEWPTWIVLLRAGHLREGAVIEMRPAQDLGGPGQPSPTLTLIAKHHAEPGAWVVRVGGTGTPESTAAILARVGRTPLPPYIVKARKAAHLDVPDLDDRRRYQTVYADPGAAASVAAPTAGLHFTPDLLKSLARAGIRRADVVLHVGTGTFRPVESEFVEQHDMHAEWCTAPGSALDAVRRTRAGGGRVIAVGTTSARTIEAFAASEQAPVAPEPGAWFETRLLISPGYPWRWTHGLLTNFHLPRSTLLALVAALFPDGVDRVRAIYAHAVREKYRFYSFGDAMLVLP